MEPILQIVREPVLVLDSRGTIEAANDGFFREFHPGRFPVKGTSLWALDKGQWDIPPLRELFETTLPRDGRADNVSLELELKGLGRRTLEVNGRCQGEHVYLALRDVTPLGAEQFIYAATHDLQEPLRTITAYLGLLTRKIEGNLDPEAAAIMKTVIEGAKRMRRLIEDIMLLSLVGRTEQIIGMVDLNIIASEVVASAGSAPGREDLTISVGKLPSVIGYPALLTQLFEQLVKNAVRFAKPDEPVKIDIDAEKKGDEWVIYVRDNGIGIEPRYHEQIFEPFRRLHAKDGTEGSGLGLSTARKIMERHRGRIWVESELGVGSTFSIALPVPPLQKEGPHVN